MNPQPGEEYHNRRIVWNWGNVVIYRESEADRNDACFLAEWREWLEHGG